MLILRVGSTSPPILSCVCPVWHGRSGLCHTLAGPKIVLVEGSLEFDPGSDLRLTCSVRLQTSEPTTIVSGLWSLVHIGMHAGVLTSKDFQRQQTEFPSSSVYTN